MKTIPFILCLLFSVSCLFAQVGIGTATPSADLEVVANASLTTGEFNGVIIPKVSVLPEGGLLPNATQKGLILYLASGTDSEGFYFFDGIKYRNVSESPIFYNEATTAHATGTTSEIFRTGRTRFGFDAAAAALVSIENPGTLVSEDRTILSITNRHSSTAMSSATRSANLLNSSAARGNKVGIENQVSSAGDGSHIGIDNQVAVNNSSTAANFGIRNVIGPFTTSNQELSGISVTTGNVASTGIIYGVRSKAINDGSNQAYSGYFEGDHFAIRNEDNSDGYEMPTTSGMTGQVLTTNGSNTATWLDIDADKLRVRATLGSDKSFTPSTPGGNSNFMSWEPLVFDSEITSTAAYDQTTGVFTAPRNGFYSFTINVRATFSLNSNELVGIAMTKNTDVNGFYQMSAYRSDEFGNRVVRTLTANVYLSSGDLINLHFGFSQTLANFNDLEANTSELIIIEQ
ncbi:MAG: hypothetical protein ACJAXY_000597 [Nonlabens sp.]|jgi:hypothetical protein|uniref:C1q-like domain-containing protein n=1 Tax=Nonlabens sp. TaxID=1888209 RepID=UPI0039E352F2